MKRNAPLGGSPMAARQPLQREGAAARGAFQASQCSAPWDEWAEEAAPQTLRQLRMRFATRAAATRAGELQQVGGTFRCGVPALEQCGMC